MNGDDNKLVFVSYAHADKKFLDKELKPFLDHLPRTDTRDIGPSRCDGSDRHLGVVQSHMLVFDYPSPKRLRSLRVV